MQSGGEGAERSAGKGKEDRNPVAKSLRALVWLVENDRDEIGVRELSAALEVAPSTGHRILNALASAGFVRQEEKSSRYTLGVELLRLAHLTISRVPIRQAALSHMRTLVDDCNESVLLGIYDPVRQAMFFTASFDSTQPLRYAIELNAWMPIHAGASGLGILAFLPDEEIRRILDRTRLIALTPNTITEPFRLQVEVQRTRERGYARSQGQRIVGAVGFAAPIFGGSEEVLGDVCLTIPEQRMHKGDEDRIAELLVRCADGITASIGGRKPEAIGERQAG